MKYLKKRLPSLLLAVMIAATCCTLFSISAFAAEVEIYSYNGVLLPNIDSIWLDKDAYPYAYISFSSSENCYYVNLTSEPAFSFTYDCCAVPADTSYIVYKIHDGDLAWVKLSSGIYTKQSVAFYHSALRWCNYNVYLEDNSLYMAASDPVLATCDGSPCPSTDANKDNICDDCGFEFAVPRDYSPPILDPSDLFSVFSRVASWLAGAVNNIVSMFWTADGGLSVLGVLAVASLAIAFIILLIYLLAGWLRF